MSTLALLILISSVAIFLLARKWEMQPRHYVPWIAAMAVLECLTATTLSAVFPATPAWALILLGLIQTGVLSAATILYFFFRDPERHAPVDPTIIVSPADGRIVYVKEITAGQFPFAVKGRKTIPLDEFAAVQLIPERGLQIGIAMNFLDVHVNRSPISGTVRMIKRIPGKFASLKHIGSLLENERVLMVFQGDQFQVGIVQIASRLVRRIVSYVDEGEQVPQGRRVGMIRFGSQVDVLLPHQDGLEVVVSKGEEVTAGESVLIRLRQTTPGDQPQSLSLSGQT